MSFRENLKNELVFQGLLVKELSNKTGINKRTLDNYLREKGNIPPVDIAVKIAKALGVSVEYLVDGVDEMQGKSELCMLLERLSLLSPKDKKLLLTTIQVMLDVMLNSN